MIEERIATPGKIVKVACLRPSDFVGAGGGGWAGEEVTPGRKQGGQRLVFLWYSTDEGSV